MADIVEITQAHLAGEVDLEEEDEVTLEDDPTGKAADGEVEEESMAAATAEAVSGWCSEWCGRWIGWCGTPPPQQQGELAAERGCGCGCGCGAATASAAETAGAAAEKEQELGRAADDVMAAAAAAAATAAAAPSSMVGPRD